jgi:hypothetical protein
MTTASTGIAADQRPWIVIIMALGEFVFGCLFLLNVAVSLFGTARIPKWARDEWWAGKNVPRAMDLARSGGWSAGRFALAVLVSAAVPAALAAPVLGIMIGWLLNPNGVLTPMERWAVITAVVGQIMWGGYLLRKQLSP